MPLFKWGLISVVIILISSNPLFAQNYGLGFFSHEARKDKRTELNLSANKEFKLDRGFTLSFDMNLQPIPSRRYGYILRIIQNDTNSIDIVYNENLKDGLWYFYLISGQHTAEMPFTIEDQFIFQNWVTFHLDFNPDTAMVTLSASDSLATSISMAFHEKDSYKIFFGACDYGNFKTRDVPIMHLKEIKIHEETKLRHHWHLNEESGTEAKDNVGRTTASVRNPDWLKPKHEDWVEIWSAKQNGSGQVAVNQADEIVYLIGRDKMIAFSVSDNSYEPIPYTNSPEFLPGCQAFYNPLDNSIYSYIVNDKSYSSFSLKTRKWEINTPDNKKETIYLHHNKHFSQTDSSLYIFGGYGQHEYKNNIQRFSLGKDNWGFLKSGGDFFAPRYLAACGNLDDTVYILGGYGSPKGKQMLSPKTYSHLMAYSLSTQQFVQKFDVKLPLQDICFSNSMVFDAQSRDYYTLAFPLLSDDGYLQLAKGSLDASYMELMGEKIPYFFHDTKSFSDLFYFPNSNKLVAYTSFLDDEQSTSMQLYSLLFPPNAASEIQKPHDANSYRNPFLLIVIIVSGIGIVLFMIYYFRRKRGTHAIVAVESDTGIQSDDLYADETTNEGLQLKSTILFFGGFQVYDKFGNDITGNFTPLLKELFLLIWLNTLKNEKGITSEKLTEILWFDKSPSSARNNKAVNIAKLRSILNEVGQCEVTHKTGYWKIICDGKEVYNDYQDFLRITKSKTNLSKQNIKRLTIIGEQGAFLVNLNHDWLDGFKASVSETMIETLYSFAKNLDIREESSLVIHIADCIFSCDSINEEAMILKCKAHHEMGSHSLSKSTYTKFCKDYLKLYDQEYEKSFADITNKPLAEIINL